MANNFDTEKYVILTKVRPGFKREFAYAYKSHSKICGGSTSLSRTRSSKNRNMVHVHEHKRIKNSCLEKNDAENIGVALNGVFSEEDARSDVEDLKNDAMDESSQPIRKIRKTNKDRRLKASNQVKKSKVVFSTFKKFPSKLKDLLDSRILDGLDVKYVRGIRVRKPGDKVFRGVIKGDGIVCYCEICKGEKVVSPAVFEVHAGSANKRPPEYTFIENGNSVRCIMNTFLNNPLDKMEEAVHAVLGNFTMKKSVFCLNCRDANVVSRLFCDLCEASKERLPSPEERLPSPTRTTETIYSRVSLAPVIPRTPEPDVPRSSSYKGMKHSAASDKNQGKITRKDQRLHKLVFQALKHGDNVTYSARGEKLLDGKINIPKSGILCSCCDKVVSPSTFEAHAGWASRRKPYLHIYTADGVSLHELSISLLKEQRISMADSDGRCSICEQGGHLLCCDGCPRTFHLECVPLESEPRAIWYCKYCCHNVNQNDRYEARDIANAQATGMVAEFDPLEQIAQRGPLTVNDTETVDGGCVLCREDDFNEEFFGPRTVIICDQCDKEYHIGCLKDHNIDNLEKLPEGNWFCGSDCLQVRTYLHNLVTRGEAPLSDSLLSMIKKKHEGKGLETNSGLDIKWRVLNWKLLASEEIRALLSKAVAIFHEQFDPIEDVETGTDFIPSMLYGRNIKEQYYFDGMYCAVLIVNQVVVCAGVFRLFGREVAELPLVATNAASQGKGYFQSLLACIEGVLGELKVERLIIPAAHEAESLWTGKFGFTELGQDEMNFYTRFYRLMMFHGTALLQKPVPRPAITECIA